MAATHEDAHLIVQITRWGTEMGLEDAAQVIFSDGFNAETATTKDPAVRKMLTFGELVATLVKQGILDRDLVLDLWWVSGMWSRVGPAAARERERLGEPRLFENIEALAESIRP